MMISQGQKVFKALDETMTDVFIAKTLFPSKNQPSSVKRTPDYDNIHMEFLSSSACSSGKDIHKTARRKPGFDRPRGRMSLWLLHMHHTELRPVYLPAALLFFPFVGQLCESYGLEARGLLIGWCIDASK